ncbi:hypothetical protein CMUS01_07916 [Colletotrichum musicola]|uniref:Uncharacterized protein n=1 Tax=Colletotrichum musicola TaxID=2175873 RepID=A0A8H6KE92_9PEZI|nr:hypothetical protein CMUS01_07916 [Colletotrichum musicola]
MAGIEYERFSSAFPLRMNDTIHDKFECCLRFKFYAISDTFLASGEYTYEPPADDEHRRLTRTRRLLAPRLNDLLQIWLPPEILTPIAGLLVRECAIVTSEEQLLGKGASDTSIDLLSDVYESYQVVDGVRYARSLFNSTSKVSEDEHHVLARKAGQAVVRKIWIAEDHRGIRDILVSGDTASQITKNYTGWASPEHPAEIIDLRTLDPLSEHPERLRMNALSCNTKGQFRYDKLLQKVRVGPTTVHVASQGHNNATQGAKRTPPKRRKGLSQLASTRDGARMARGSGMALMSLRTTVLRIKVVRKSATAIQPGATERNQTDLTDEWVNRRAQHSGHTRALSSESASQLREDSPWATE